VACGAGLGEDAFARVYAHSGMVGYQGAKMSKSLGNLVFVSRLRADGVDPMAIRLALLAHHYKSDWEWTGEELARAQARLDRWRAAVAVTAPPAEPTAAAVLAEIRERMADDLDAPGSVAAIDAWADAALAGPGGAALAGAGGAAGAAGDAALVRDTADALLGVAL
jgi:L-cysteine:1D-myo-inositol 2-amino-2-deoxy-alpha-D-glucopyranoside ligase